MAKSAKVDLYSVCNSTEAIRIQYGVSFWLIQEKACFTYKEAVFYLAIYRGETDKELADRFKISIKRVKKFVNPQRKNLNGMGVRIKY